jgi:hypothetical protein
MTEYTKACIGIFALQVLLCAVVIGVLVGWSAVCDLLPQPYAAIVFAAVPVLLGMGFITTQLVKENGDVV